MGSMKKITRALTTEQMVNADIHGLASVSLLCMCGAVDDRMRLDVAGISPPCPACGRRYSIGKLRFYDPSAPQIDAALIY